MRFFAHAHARRHAGEQHRVVNGCWILLAVCLFSTLRLSAATLGCFQYQGSLLTNGEPVSGQLEITFSLHSVPTGGTPLHEEKQAVLVSNGLFAVEICLPRDFDRADQILYLGLEVEGYLAGPRQLIGSAGYAFRATEVAANAIGSNSVAGGAILVQHLYHGDFVESINGLKDAFAIQAGPGITVTRTSQVFTVGLSNLNVGQAGNLACAFPVAPYESVRAGDIAHLTEGSIHRGCWGSEHVLTNDVATHFFGAALDAGRFVLAYKMRTNGYVVIGSVQGRNVTLGQAWLITDTAFSTWERSVAVLSSNRFVVAYKDKDGHGWLRVGEVTGTTINTLGTRIDFTAPVGAGLVNTFAVCALTDSRIGLVFNYDGDGFLYGLIGDVSGTSITWPGSYGFVSAAPDTVAITAKSSSKVLVAYGSDDGYGVHAQADAGGSFVFSTPRNFNLENTYEVAVAALNQYDYVVAYVTTNFEAKVRGYVNSTWSEPVVFSSHAHSISLCYLTNGQFILTYGGELVYSANLMRQGVIQGLSVALGEQVQITDGGAYSANQFHAWRQDQNTVAAAYYQSFLLNLPLLSVGKYGPPIGVVKADHAAGEQAEVILSGVAEVFSNLTPGAIYYHDGNGRATNAYWQGRRLGLSISPTSIYLNPQWDWK